MISISMCFGLHNLQLILPKGLPMWSDCWVESALISDVLVYLLTQTCQIPQAEEERGLNCQKAESTHSHYLTPWATLYFWDPNHGCQMAIFRF